MASKFRMWWQKSRSHSWWENIRSGLGWLWQKRQHHPFIAMGILVLLIALIAFALAVHWSGWDWTGFTGYSPPTPQYQRGKTLWDWLQLLVIPLMLAIGGFWLNQLQKSREERATAQRDQTEREIAADNQREAALQAYLDKMSELFLEKEQQLHYTSAAADEIRKIARVRTLTVLRRLDPIRKASVIQFLHESGLIDKDTCIISLKGADLREADLMGADLHGADLTIANLSGANLRNTHLLGAHLRGADLRKANLSGAHLGWDNFETSLHEIHRMLGGQGWADLGVRLGLLVQSPPAQNIVTLYELYLRAPDKFGADLVVGLRKFYLMSSKSGDDLREAHLITDLREAHLSGAHLRNADLSFADLRGADLRLANLKYARGITAEELEKQALLQDATMPDGSKHP